MASAANCPEGSSLEKAPSVNIGPGAMQFIRMPLRPHSTPRDLKSKNCKRILQFVYSNVEDGLSPTVSFCTKLLLSLALRLAYFIMASTPDLAHALGTT